MTHSLRSSAGAGSMRAHHWSAFAWAALAAGTLQSGCRTAGVGSEFTPAATTAAMPTPTTARPAVRPGAGVVAAPVADGVIRAEIGELAPDFQLVDLGGQVQKLSHHRGKIVVLEWFDPDCPFVLHAYDEGLLPEMQSRYAAAGIVWLAIHSSSPGTADADAASSLAFATQHRLRLSISMDPMGRIGRTYGARTTPHLCVINERGALVYSGGLDNAPMGRVASAATRTNYVDAAILDLRSGHAVTTSSTRAYGTAIQYGRP